MLCIRGDSVGRPDRARRRTPASLLNLPFESRDAQPGVPAARMLRKEGLVQRKNASSNPDAKSKDVDDSVPRQESEDDVDSKETRLTLMEEVLLLGLKEKEASTIPFVGSDFGLGEAAGASTANRAELSGRTGIVVFFFFFLACSRAG